MPEIISEGLIGKARVLIRLSLAMALGFHGFRKQTTVFTSPEMFYHLSFVDGRLEQTSQTQRSWNFVCQILSDVRPPFAKGFPSKVFVAREGHI